MWAAVYSHGSWDGNPDGYIHTYINTYIHICCEFRCSGTGNDIRIERRQVVFLCWKQDSNMEVSRHLIVSRLNAHSQTDWAIEDQAKNLNSTAHPYDEWAFSPLDFTAVWLSHLALALYMFVVNFDALAQASDIRIHTHIHTYIHTNTHTYIYIYIYK